MVFQYPFQRIRNVPAPAAHPIDACKELEKHRHVFPYVAHARYFFVRESSNPTLKMARRTDTVAPHANSRLLAVSECVFERLVVVRHKNYGGLFKVFEVHVGVPLANLAGVRAHDALPQPEARAVPFSPVAVAAQVEPAKARVAVVAGGERLYEFFMRLHKYGIAKFGNGYFNYAVGKFFVGLFLHCVHCIFCALVKHPFRGIVELRIPRCAYAHYAEVKRQPLL